MIEIKHALTKIRQIGQRGLEAVGIIAAGRDIQNRFDQIKDKATGSEIEIMEDVRSEIGCATCPLYQSRIKEIGIAKIGEIQTNFGLLVVSASCDGFSGMNPYVHGKSQSPHLFHARVLIQTLKPEDTTDRQIKEGKPNCDPDNDMGNRFVTVYKRILTDFIK